jgi:hypothetical protein
VPPPIYEDEQVQEMSRMQSGVSWLNSSTQAHCIPPGSSALEAGLANKQEEISTAFLALM